MCYDLSRYVSYTMYLHARMFEEIGGERRDCFAWERDSGCFCSVAAAGSPPESINRSAASAGREFAKKRDRRRNKNSTPISHPFLHKGFLGKNWRISNCHCANLIFLFLFFRERKIWERKEEKLKFLVSIMEGEKDENWERQKQAKEERDIKFSEEIKLPARSFPLAPLSSSYLLSSFPWKNKRCCLLSLSSSLHSYKKPDPPPPSNFPPELPLYYFCGK